MPDVLSGFLLFIVHDALRPYYLVIRTNVLGQEITLPVRWPLFCHCLANAVEQWQPDITFGQLNDRWKRLCLVSWAAAPCV